MLQQTQVERVQPKYEAFLAAFPTVEGLARSPLKSVLEVWRGLGYNRRALSLHRLAGVVVRDFGGSLPRARLDLLRLPGVGPSTAGALMAFAFEEPVAFIETNIRRVFLHFFFPNRECVPDGRILPYVEATLDARDVRSWYYALMDYGAMLGKMEAENPNRRSAHYRTQSPFKGSDREMRGRLIRTLVEDGPLSVDGLIARCGGDPGRTSALLKRLADEGLVHVSGALAAIKDAGGCVAPPREPRGEV
jgi:A/G-specific adenine glycosylase